MKSGERGLTYLQLKGRGERYGTIRTFEPGKESRCREGKIKRGGGLEHIQRKKREPDPWGGRLISTLGRRRGAVNKRGEKGRPSNKPRGAHTGILLLGEGRFREKEGLFQRKGRFSALKRMTIPRNTKFSVTAWRSEMKKKSDRKGGR